MRKIFNIALYSLLWLSIVVIQAEAHGIGVPVIVDTDAASDDQRALAMLLQSGTADLSLIVTSDGILSPSFGKAKIENLLDYFDRKDIFVVAGITSNKPEPPCRSVLEKAWGYAAEGECDTTTPSDAAVEAIARVLRSRRGKTFYLCLGPLTNLAAALQEDPTLNGKIAQVVYFGNPPDASDPGWNTKRDLEAAQTVFHAGVNVRALGFPDERMLPFNEEIYKTITVLPTPAARFVTSIHQEPAMQRMMNEGHLLVWDELAVLYLNQPSLFTLTPYNAARKVLTLDSFDREGVRAAYVKLFGHPADYHLDSRRAVTLKAFPQDPGLFRDDLAPYVEKIINAHGVEEWKACLLTNELHRHLGIYSLVGAKMGVRAREILEAPFDTVHVISFGGSTPPWSCLNDGLQVSTGASLGRGAIEVDGTQSKPEAVFLYRTNRLRLALKPLWKKKIREDLDAAVKKYGRNTTAYFSHIREISIQYWLTMDRNEMFEEVRE